MPQKNITECINENIKMNDKTGYSIHSYVIFATLIAETYHI